MKLLGICGSPRKANTYYMIKKVLESAGQDYEIIFLADKNINQCLDCKKCHKTHRCAQQDDMQGLIDKIKAASGVVLGSPTYFDNVSGVMKKFMDRCLPYCSELFSKEFVGKKAVLLSVGNFQEYLEFDDKGNSKWGEEETTSVMRCVDALENFSRIVGFNVVCKVWATQSNPQAKDGELVKAGKLISQ